MKALLDFLALILFFIIYYITKDIKTATAVAIIAGIIQSIIIWVKYKKLEPMQWLSLVLIIIFGGATILLNKPIFIKIKPSLLFWMFAIALIFGFIFKKLYLKSILGKEIELPNNIWKNLTIAWIMFFIIMGIINLVVALYFSDEIWVTYKTFGLMGIMFIFLILQGIYIHKNNGFKIK